MSKVLKVVADILVILFIVAAAAIFVPPLFGVTTAVATPQVTTNMQQGTVAYGKRVPLEELVSGDKIIYSGDDYALLCEVDSVDPETDIVTVNVEGTTQQIQFHNSAAKTLFTVPVIGYMSIALQTFEGRIILGLIAALIVVLFIVAEVWSNKERDDREYELEEEEDDDEYFRGLAKNAARGQNNRTVYREKPAPTQPVSSEVDAFAAADAGISGVAAAGAVKAAADGAVMDRETTKINLDEAPIVEEEEVDPEEERKFWQTNEESDAMLREIAAAQEAVIAEEAARNALEEKTAADIEKNTGETAEEKADGKKADGKKAEREADTPAGEEKTAEPEKATPEGEKGKDNTQQAQPAGTYRTEGEDFSDIDDSQMAEMETALETALVHAGENDNVDHSKTAAAAVETAASVAAEETPDEIELAIPVRTLEEILQDAYSNGEDPHIRKDPATGITLVDFSETFAD